MKTTRSAGVWGGTHLLIPFAVLAFWGAMMWQLVQREVLPGIGQSAPVTYQSILSGAAFPFEERYSISFLRKPIGTMESAYEREEGGYRIRNQIQCNFGAGSAR